MEFIRKIVKACRGAGVTNLPESPTPMSDKQVRHRKKKRNRAKQSRKRNRKR